MSSNFLSFVPVMDRKPHLQINRSRSSVLAVIAALAVVLVAKIEPANAQLSKATQILLNRGVELQGMVQYADIFTLSVYSNAGLGRFLAAIELARGRGVKIAFDGNFRPRAWRGDLTRTRTVFAEALKRKREGGTPPDKAAGLVALLA